jgi:polyisoprenoid-binding protein YceI
VPTASVFTNHERRDQHLRGSDFLNIEEFPEMVFVGRNAEPLGERTGRVTGELTLLGVTPPLTMRSASTPAGRSGAASSA